MSKFIAAVPVEDFFASMKGNIIEAADGETIDGSNLLYLCRIASTFAPGFYVDFKGGQSAVPTFSGAVPYVMYSHKLHNGTPYERWRNYTKVSYALGHYNAGIELYGKDALEVPDFTLDELADLRQVAMTYGQAVQAPTAWALRSCSTLLKADTKEYHVAFDALPAPIKRMLIQSWLLNAEHRTKYMILDPNNWDKMPDSIDEQMQDVVNDQTPW
ncbi:MAG: hypothetical protein GY810_32400 [Aureispira sp.]|nr:hypothetical protein [Aureispira sp.]